jgi:hypothetical protein
MILQYSKKSHLPVDFHAYFAQTQRELDPHVVLFVLVALHDVDAQSGLHSLLTVEFVQIHAAIVEYKLHLRATDWQGMGESCNQNQFSYVDRRNIIDMRRCLQFLSQFADKRLKRTRYSPNKEPGIRLQVLIDLDIMGRSQVAMNGRWVFEAHVDVL